MSMEFGELFQKMTGHPPMRWQNRLYQSFLNDEIPQTISLPTGLGKTSVIHVRLLALAHQSMQGQVCLPRRLVYIVNRRTVVDQATTEVEKLVERMKTPELADFRELLSRMCAFTSDEPLVVSTLRGQLADNATWRMDPSRPAVIIGTVDMIGSRLLFSGYGMGIRSRPLHAGLLGQDTLVVHDESHLEPAFQSLLRSIETAQRGDSDPWKILVMALSATLRGDETGFSLEAADLTEDLVRQRMNAKKSLTFQKVPNETDFPEKAAALALEFHNSGQTVIVFSQRVDHVLKIQEALEKAKCKQCVLTGTLRGLERDRLAVDNPVFARFLPQSQPPTATETVYLICTSAGEVGVNISADHMICDLACFDSMAQRLGRVNRFGKGDARIQVVTWDPPVGKEDSPPYPELKKTDSVLRKLRTLEEGVYDASPAALAMLDAGEKSAAFSPAPEILPSTEILFDAWACTSLGSRLPGALPVAEFLHGVTEWEQPTMRVAWREEAQPGLLPLTAARKQALLEDFPIKPHETLRDSCTRVVRHLKELVKRLPEATGWLLPGSGEARFDILLCDLLEDEQNLRESTLLLPPAVGCLNAEGLLDGRSAHQAGIRYDVSCEHPGRYRFWDEHAPPIGCRLVFSIDTRPEQDESGDEESVGARFWKWYVMPASADDDGSRSTLRTVALEEHGSAAKQAARKLADRLHLAAEIENVLSLAAVWHDLGKRRSLWQRSIGNRQYPQVVLAKSDIRMRPQDLGNYRHELGSLLDIQRLPEFRALPTDMQELVMHLVGAHHGRCRPVFLEDEGY